MLIAPFDKAIIKSGKGNLFIKCLGPNTTNRQVYDLFRTCGDIFSCRIAKDLTGKSKCYGFVQYRNPEDATNAIKALNGTKLGEKNLIVDMYVSPDKRPRVDRAFTNVYVKNLPPSITTKEALKALFAAYGEISSVGVDKRELNGKAGFYGFLNFVKPEDATKAIAEMHDKEIEGVKIHVCKALTKDQRIREKLRQKYELNAKSRLYTVHVKSSDNSPLDEAAVRSQLSSFGDIKQINIRKTRIGENQEVNSAVAFVVFANPESASKASVEYKGTLLVSMLEGKDQRARGFAHGMRAPDYSSMMNPHFAPGAHMRPGGYPRAPYQQRGRGRPRGRGYPPRQGMEYGQFPPRPGMFMAPQFGYPPNGQYQMPPYGQMQPMMGPMGPMGPMQMQMPMQGMMPMGMPPGAQMPMMLRPQMMQDPGMQVQVAPSSELQLPAGKDEYGELFYPKVQQQVNDE